MSVEHVHPDYSESLLNWQTVRDVINNDAQCYIRYLDPLDKTEANILRNRAYRQGAVLVNFTSLTVDGLTGLIFRKPPQVKIPKQLDYMKEGAADDGRSLNTFARDIAGELVAVGRAGILVDFPKSDSDMFTSDNDLHAKFTEYKTESISNWRIQRVNGKLQLTQVVLKEQVQKVTDDGFTYKTEDQWRVLRLEKVGDELVYKQLLFSLDGTVTETIPLDYNQQTWSEIPFTFVGAKNNSATIDKPPVLDIALLNLAHYQNSADLEESGHVVGQPTLILKTSFDPQLFAEANPNGIRLGCRAAYNLGADGDGKFLQVNPNQMVEMMMRHKETQAAFIGARLISPAGGRETAEAARMRFGSSNSQLAHLTSNLSDAIKQCLAWACKFEGVTSTKGIIFRLNDKFFDEGVDPQVLMQTIMLIQERVIPKSVVQNYLREAGMIPDDVSNEELDTEIEETTELDDLLTTPVKQPLLPNQKEPVEPDADNETD